MGRQHLRTWNRKQGTVVPKTPRRRPVRIPRASNRSVSKTRTCTGTCTGRRHSIDPRSRGGGGAMTLSKLIRRKQKQKLSPDPRDERDRSRSIDAPPDALAEIFKGNPKQFPNQGTNHDAVKSNSKGSKPRSQSASPNARYQSTDPPAKTSPGAMPMLRRSNLP